MKKITCEYRGFEYRDGHPIFVVRVNKEVTFGEIPEPPEIPKVELKVLQLKSIQLVERASVPLRRINRWELSPKRKKLVEIAELCTKVSLPVSVGASIVGTIASITSVVYPPAAPIGVPIAIGSWITTATTGFFAVGGKAAKALALAYPRRVRYVNFAAEVKEKGGLSRRYEYLAETRFLGSMPEKDYNVFCEALAQRDNVPRKLAIQQEFAKAKA